MLAPPRRRHLAEPGERVIAIVELLRRYERRVDAVRVERVDDDAAVQHTFGGVQSRMRGEDLGEREIELECAPDDGRRTPRVS